MALFTKKITRFFQIDFSKGDFASHSYEDIRRIKMVNTIGFIGIANLLLYCIIDSVIGFKLYLPVIIFYFISALLTFGVIILNTHRYFNIAKILIVLIFPFYITVNSVIFFGTVAHSHVFVLLFSLIPLFLWSYNEKGYLIGFIGFDLLLYLIIEFLPPLIEPLYSIQETYIGFFKSTNVFIAFLGAAIAIFYFQKFSNQKEVQLLEQAAELEKSQKHRDLIYSIIAHDLRSPFNGLVGLSDIMVKKYDELDDDKLKHFLGAINLTANNLNNLLLNLLDWSKMQSGNLSTNFESFKLKQIIDEVISIHNDLLIKKGLKLISEIDSNIAVFADRYMVSTITRNLLTNAIKFTPEGGVIEIKTKPVNNFVEIAVRDSGIGIPQSKIGKLMCSDCNFIVPGTNNEKGSGLGLRICKDFVNANGGEIWVDSNENMGTCFYFTLNTENWMTVTPNT